jgi:hypothetical protein
MRVSAGVLALVLAACAIDPVEQHLDDPWGSNGSVFEMDVYPVDYQDNPGETYLMCGSPCPPPRRWEPSGVIRPLQPGVFDGMDGTQRVRMRVRFDASCFAPEAICAHFFWRYDEVQE